MLTTIAVIEDYLGTTLDSAQTALYTQIIEAVSGYIEGVCDCQFSDAIYSERIHIHCGQLRVRNPVQFVYGCRTGAVDVIEVSPPADGVVSIERLPTAMTLRLVEGLAFSQAALTAATISGTVAAINAESAWASSLVDAAYAPVRAQYLADDTRQDGDTGFIYLQAFVTPVITRRQTIRLFNTSTGDGPGVMVYRGGYATIPADLQDAATRMVIKAYADRNPSTTVSGDLKSETVGDYTYSKFTANELTASFNELSVPYQAVFDKYRNWSI